MVHKARKRFGQHFLHDQGVIESIVRAVRPLSGETIIEIGPGLSAITKPLIQQAGHLTVIEIDRDLANKLKAENSPEKLTVVCNDALSVDFSSFGNNLRLVGNLPYNISSPLLFHLAEYADNIRDQHFMLQLEVIERMVASPSTAQYGRLSVMLQERYRMYNLFEVEPDAFDPPPKVMSAVVKMVPLPDTRLKPISHKIFSNVVTRAFGQRRKMIRKSLSEWSSLISWDKLGIPDTARAQDITVHQFISLSNMIHQKTSNTPK